MSIEMVPLGKGKVSREQAIQDLKEIENSMNVALRKILEGVRTWIVRNVEWGLRRTWKLGKTLKRVHDQEAKYGSRAVERMSEVLLCDKGVLTKAMHFYRAFPEKKLEKLLKLRMKVSGEPVTYTHIDKLITVPNEAQRDKLLQECVDNDWTPEELAYHIQVMYREATGQTKLPHAGGRPRKVPTTIVQLLTNFERATGVLVRDDPLMYNHPLVNFVRFVDNLPADKVTPELLARVDTCLDNIDKATVVLDSVKPQLLEARARAERKMQAQAEQQGIVDAEVVESRPAEAESDTGDNGRDNGRDNGHAFEQARKPKLIGHKQ